MKAAALLMAKSILLSRAMAPLTMVIIFFDWVLFWFNSVISFRDLIFCKINGSFSSSLPGFHLRSAESWVKWPPTFDGNNEAKPLLLEW